MMQTTFLPVITSTLGCHNLTQLMTNSTTTLKYLIHKKLHRFSAVPVFWNSDFPFSLTYTFTHAVAHPAASEGTVQAAVQYKGSSHTGQLAGLEHFLHSISNPQEECRSRRKILMANSHKYSFTVITWEKQPRADSGAMGNRVLSSHDSDASFKTQWNCLDAANRLFKSKSFCSLHRYPCFVEGGRSSKFH